MTNYNERLDDVLETVIAEAFIFGNLALGMGVDIKLPDDDHELPPKEKAKQSITSLIKELVAEAKPKITFSKPEGMPNTLAVDFAQRHLDEFEQNLLKALSSSGKE